jgi:hypothetical protein
LELAPVVQPRIQSRFEPASAAAPAAPDQTVEVETPTQSTITPKIAEVRVDDRKPQVEREQPPRVDFQQVINTVRNTYVASHEVVQVPIVEKVRERIHTETRIHTEKSTDSRLEIRENQIPEPAPAPEAPKQNPPNPRLNLVEPAPVTKEAPVPTPPPIVPRVVTRIEPAPVAPAPRFEVPPVIQSEPTETINVTIGRVDVRAVFSSQAPAAPARSRSASVNSLDDYLKQRSEGRR